MNCANFQWEKNGVILDDYSIIDYIMRLKIILNNEHQKVIRNVSGMSRPAVFGVDFTQSQEAWQGSYRVGN